MLGRWGVRVRLGALWDRAGAGSPPRPGSPKKGGRWDTASRKGPVSICLSAGSGFSRCSASSAISGSRPAVMPQPAPRASTPPPGLPPSALGPSALGPSLPPAADSGDASVATSARAASRVAERSAPPAGRAPKRPAVPPRPCPPAPIRARRRARQPNPRPLPRTSAPPLVRGRGRPVRRGSEPTRRSRSSQVSRSQTSLSQVFLHVLPFRPQPGCASGRVLTKGGVELLRSNAAHLPAQVYSPKQPALLRTPVSSGTEPVLQQPQVAC